MREAEGGDVRLTKHCREKCNFWGIFVFRTGNVSRRTRHSCCVTGIRIVSVTVEDEAFIRLKNTHSPKDFALYLFVKKHITF